MFGLGYQELLLILVIVLVLFGGSKLPDLAKSLGRSMKEFKKGIAAEPEEDSRSSTPARSATVTSTAPRLAAPASLRWMWPEHIAHAAGRSWRRVRLQLRRSSSWRADFRRAWSRFGARCRQSPDGGPAFGAATRVTEPACRGPTNAPRLVTWIGS